MPWIRSASVELRAARQLEIIERCRPYSDVINLGDLYASYAAMNAATAPLG
jgi:hypothetical protein